MVFGKSYDEIKEWVISVFRPLDGFSVAFFVPKDKVFTDTGFENPDLAAAFLSTKSVMQMMSDARTKANATLALQESGFDIYLEEEVVFNTQYFKISALHPRKDSDGLKKRNERIQKGQLELINLKKEILKEASERMNKLKTFDSNDKDFQKICEKLQNLLDNRLN